MTDRIDILNQQLANNKKMEELREKTAMFIQIAHLGLFPLEDILRVMQDLNDAISFLNKHHSEMIEISFSLIDALEQLEPQKE